MIYIVCIVLMSQSTSEAGDVGPATADFFSSDCYGLSGFDLTVEHPEESNNAILDILT